MQRCSIADSATRGVETTAGTTAALNAALTLENVASTRHTGAAHLALLANSLHGATEKLLVVARAGFAAEEHEVMKAGGKTIVVRFTAAGSSAIEE